MINTNPAVLPAGYYTGRIAQGHYYADQLRPANPSFYDKYLKVSLSNPFAYSDNINLKDENKRLVSLYQQIKINQGPDIERFKLEIKNKLDHEKAELNVNLGIMNSHFKKGNQLSLLSEIVLKIVNFILPLFGYAPYEIPQPYQEIDENIFRTFEKANCRLTEAEIAHSKYLVESNDNLIAHLNLTEAFEKVRLGLESTVHIEIDKNNQYLVSFNEKSQNFSLIGHFEEEEDLPNGETTLSKNIRVEDPMSKNIHYEILSNRFIKDRKSAALVSFSYQQMQTITLEPGLIYWLSSEEPLARFKITARNV